MASSRKSINVRLDDEIYSQITELAKRKGMSRGAVVRAFIDNKTFNSKIDTLNEEQYYELQMNILGLINEISHIETVMNRMGNNVNQIAKKINASSHTQNDINTVKMISVALDDMKNEVSRLVRKIDDWR